MFICA